MKKVRYSHEEGQFNFKEDDYVTDELYYHGTLKEIDSEGFWAILDNDKSKEEYFAFTDLENIIQGHLIPFLGGYTRRQK
ncbi:hypothetical protein P4T62_28645 [Bacillus mycoides]|uniref:hypothetical protein n=1 Tax=Bacillus mycoides TaxID=1405 RepID=UPI002E1AAEA3|nr:hypothetical protein [Bacillus mycoides]